MKDTLSSMELISAVDVSRRGISIRPGQRFADEYLRDDFWVRYEGDGAGRAIDEGLAAVPFLASVAPVVWLAGIDASVPVLDATFAHALDDVRAVYADMYPEVAWTGSIAADRLTSPDERGEQVALLFSGGVDSVYSSITIGDPQLLVTVRGSDIALENDRGWNVVRGSVADFARARGHRNAFAESNFRRFLDLAALERQWPALGGWWGKVQHGIGLLGLLAPIVPAGRVVIAATHTPAFDGAVWGSNPNLDASVKWGGVEVDHHGYGASRQDKIESIVAAGGRPPSLRVCYSNPYGDGRNCGVCEKCLRTFAGLVVARAQPLAYGMPLSRRQGARMVRRRFATYRVALNANQACHWIGIQDALARRAGELDDGLDNSELAGFLRWLSAFDFAAYERRWRLLLRLRGCLLRTGRRFPAAERAGRRLVAALHRLRGGVRSRRGAGWAPY